MAKLKILNMDEIPVTEVEWLWYPYIPYGKITIVHGDPGDGKTMMILQLASILSRGDKMPCDDTEREPIKIIYQTAEDGLSDTIKPRLLAGNADCTQIKVIDESEAALSMLDEPLQDGLYLWQGDITTLQCDGIVNAANNQMLGCFCPNHGCIDNAIHTFAGVQLRLACAELMRKQGHEEETGKAKITPAYNLPCRYVLHTVGPIIQGSLTKQECDLLASCYRSCLELAEQNNLKSIAFCCISTGEFHFPNDKAAEIAIQTVKEYKAQTHSRIEVIFNVFKELDYNIYQELLRAN